jgi:hypothetical protein
MGAIDSSNASLRSLRDEINLPTVLSLLFWFTQDTIDIDIFSPPQQDWMDGTADYFEEID